MRTVNKCVIGMTYNDWLNCTEVKGQAQNKYWMIRFNEIFEVLIIDHYNPIPVRKSLSNRAH